MLETPHGFLTYGFNCVPGVSFPHIFIEDLYVVPDMRKSHIATTMADRVAGIAKERGIIKMIGAVRLGRDGADTRLEVLKRYGMRLLAAQDQIIFVIKDL